MITIGSVEENMGHILKVQRGAENVVTVLVSCHESHCPYAVIVFDDDCGELITRINCKNMSIAEGHYGHYVRNAKKYAL